MRNDHRLENGRQKDMIYMKAHQVFSRKALYYSRLMSVTYNRITVREQKTRWGSCSSRRNLNFNWRLLLAPDEIVDYVVVHELAHLREMNHSAKFYAIIESILPDYKNRQNWLKENGYRLFLMGPDSILSQAEHSLTPAQLPSGQVRDKSRML